MLVSFSSDYSKDIMNNMVSVFDTKNMDFVSQVDFGKARFLAKVNGLAFTVVAGRFMVNGVEVCSKISTGTVENVTALANTTVEVISTVATAVNTTVTTGAELLSVTAENVTALANAIMEAANTTITTVNSLAPYMQTISQTAYLVAALFYSNSPSSTDVSEAIAVIGGALASFLKSEVMGITVVDTKTFNSFVSTRCSGKEDKDWEMVTVEPDHVSVAFASFDPDPCSSKDEDWELIDY